MMRPAASVPPPFYPWGGYGAPPCVIPPLPVTPEMLAAIAGAISAGVTDVKYADREVKYGSMAELLRAYSWLLWQMCPQLTLPRRSLMVSGKGLPPGAPVWPYMPEHHQYAVPTPWDTYRDPTLRRPPPRIVPPPLAA
jgi:hypothetical protein